MPLRQETQQLLADVAESLHRSADVLQRWTVTTETKNVKLGILGPALPAELDSPEASGEQIAAEDIRNEAEDFLPLLVGDGHDRVEVETSQREEIVVRALPNMDMARPLATADAPEANPLLGAEMVFSRRPGRLIRATLLSPPLPWLARLMMRDMQAEVTFVDIEGVPMVSEMTTKMRSRGVGRFRFDYVFAASATYEPRSPA